ncbi:MAG: tetratricopeptide repeat protein, partial [Candidatus Latescibacterota bacterium]
MIIKKKQRKTEFVDRNHDVMSSYYNIAQAYTNRNRKMTRAKLSRLIQRDPDFFDSYIILSRVALSEGNAEEARQLLDTAYERALRYITDEEGNWPDILEWSWLENRHIIRTFVHKGIQYWRDGKKEEALRLYRKALRTNPGDHPGIRYFILAIREGMSFEEYDGRFTQGGFYTPEVAEWFDREMKKYPDE